jgi:hypothetical protein
MPQFDISSFPVQIFWLFILLTIMYVFITYQLLPMILFLIKIRAKVYLKKSNLYQKISIKDTNFYTLNKK